MNKTPCENVDYEAGDEFVLLSDAGPLSKGAIVKAANAGRIDGGLDIFKCRGSAFWLDPLNMQKLDTDGWIEWKGGEMPVERGTLVDLMFRSYGKQAYLCCIAGNYFWHHDGDGSDIIAYRLHQEEKPELEQAVPTLDGLMHAWQKAKANADTSRNILKLAEQEESAARKALDDALLAAGWGETAKDDPLNITDWRDLKPGDIVWWDGGAGGVKPGEYPVYLVEPRDTPSDLTFLVTYRPGREAWVKGNTSQWHFVRRPPKKR
ncbi:hypothetical protein [Edwardsiella piscicida]|uniref:hypothetical protein n=1 Tax=Edwardsiella piscicida TaxID=1263550 RepID=UPI0011B201A5|nr:hypothetical protein [Edwardsiella piscicida]UCQ42997.1 hypothetical protein DCF39_09320 [Edwardsiella piscicida]